MTREEIRESINYTLEKAWENPSEARYYLEQLPYDTNSDYDNTVHEFFISALAYEIREANRENFEIVSNDLVEHYFVNQEYYEF